MRKRRRNAAIPARAWLESYVANRSRLSRLVGLFVRPHEIEDIVQETFVRSYVAACSQAIENPGAFMLRTARNLALNSQNRAENRWNQSIDDCPEFHSVLRAEETPESYCQTQEQFLAFCDAVAGLPVHCRRVFILKKVYGLTQKEISDYLGISESTVKKHVTKGMVITAQYMLDKGYSVGPARRSLSADPPDEVQKS